MSVMPGRFVARFIGRTRSLWWSAYRRVMPHNAVWRAGLIHEVQHWENWLEWPKYSKDREFRLDVRSELQEELCIVLAERKSEAIIKILDVGAGPLTRIGKCWGNRRIEIVPVDPLADVYDYLLRDKGIVPPVRTIKAEAESMVSSGTISKAEFDLAYAHNALDHSHDPFEAIRQMIMAVRSGGIVFLDHRLNEASRVGWSGLHQWNFSIVGGEVTISDWKRKRLLREEIGDRYVIHPRKVVKDTSLEGGMEVDNRLQVLIEVP